jgi:hypothetical protein
MVYIYIFFICITLVQRSYSNQIKQTLTGIKGNPADGCFMKPISKVISRDIRYIRLPTVTADETQCVPRLMYKNRTTV